MVKSVTVPTASLYPDADSTRESPARHKTGDHRNAFRRDLARLVHSPSFRRLQGKTQLFPSHENDFYRNRLTHSIEVAQIATGIATNLNGRSYFKSDPIDISLVTFAALAHDIGHPPFGHNGERVLDHLMLNHGGFEGNAQTLRILSRLEKKETTTFPAQTKTFTVATETEDLRLGLNLTHRTLASIIKYYSKIPKSKERRLEDGTGGHPVKGYYYEEADLVDRVTKTVFGFQPSLGTKTLECSIMDVSDDIAYSTYDLEDAFKADFLSPIRILSIRDNVRTRIIGEVNKKLRREYPTSNRTMEDSDFFEVVKEIFGDLFEVSSKIRAAFVSGSADLDEVALATAIEAYGGSRDLVDTGYFRTEFTSKLVHKFISGIRFSTDHGRPVLSKVKFSVDTFIAVETLKNIVYTLQIMSPRMKMAERRGREMITTIFKVLVDNNGGRDLLPEDWREVYVAQTDPKWRRRTVCDFVASMTDRYCVEFYSRLVGIEPPSIHKPY